MRALILILLIPAVAFAEIEGYRVDVLGNGPPGFEQPRCVRTGPSGTLWFLEGSNDNVRGRVLDPAGGFKTVLRFGVNGLRSKEPGRWFHPASLRPSRNGVLVADTGNRRVLRFDLDGKFIGVVAGEGEGREALAGPTDALQLDDGRIVVCDAGSSRVLLFTAKGRLDRVIASSGGKPDQVNGAFSLARDGEGDLWVVDTLNHRLVERDRAFRLKRVLRPFDGEVPLFRSICYLDFDAEGNLYVADAGASCVLKMSPDGELLERIGVLDDGRRPTVTPSGVALTSAGEAVVADVDRNVSERFDADGGFRGFVGVPHSRKERIHPVAMSAGRDGTLFRVWVEPESTIQTFGPDGVLRAEFGGRGEADGKLLRPRDADAGPDGRLYVVDTERHDVTVYRADGALVRVFGRKGHGPGELLYPRAVAVANDGTVFIADAGNRRIERFERNGKHLGTFVSNVDPHRIDVDDAGRLVMLDEAAEAVVLFDPEAREIMRAHVGPNTAASEPVFATDGRIWMLDRNSGGILAFDREGKATTLATDAHLKGPVQLFGGADGRVRAGTNADFIALQPDGTIQAITPALRKAERGFPLMPSSIAALDDGLAVLSRETASVHVFAKDGRFLRMLPLKAPIVGPRQIASHPKGGLAVLCPIEGEIFRLHDGNVERIASGKTLQAAYAFALDDAGNVFIVDDEARTIRKLDPIGRELAVPGYPEGVEAPRSPSALSVTAAGDVLTADMRGGDVLCFGPDLAFKWRIVQKSLPARERLWGGVSTLGVDADGKIYVLSKYDNTVQIFDRDRKHLCNIHLSANGVGALKMPDDMLVTPDGTILIADTGNNRIVRLTPTDH